MRRGGAPSAGVVLTVLAARATEFFRSLFSPAEIVVPPSIRPAPRIACECNPRGVRDLEIIRPALQRRG
jgi:hypothetical protein